MHWPAYSGFFYSGVLINSIWYTAMMVPYAINRHGHIAAYYFLVYGCTTIGLGYIWAAEIGISGAAMALLLSEVVMAVFVINVSLPMTSISIVNWAKIVSRPPFGQLGRISLYFLKRLEFISH
jgi:hypothetical protein